jgi:hypothetical protein
MTITRPDGDEFVVLYDEADAELVRGRTWSLDKALYVYCKTSSVAGQTVRTLYLARLLLGLEPGDGLRGDHANGNPLDNRRSNLRALTNAENCANQRVVNDRGTSRFRGVQWKPDRGRWRAQVRHNYRSHHVGYFATEDEAAVAVAEFRRKRGLPAGY